MIYKFKLLIIIALFVLFSCQTTTKPKYAYNFCYINYNYKDCATARNLIVKARSISDDYVNTAFDVLPTNDINAFADSRNNKIIFTSGPLNNFTDNELIFILFHENTHLENKHAEAIQAASTGIDLGFRILNIFVPGAGYGNLLVNPLATRGYSRSNELEADTEAVRICTHKGGMDYKTYINVLNKLATLSNQGKVEQKIKIGLFDTHPGYQERIENIEQFINNNVH